MATFKTLAVWFALAAASGVAWADHGHFSHGGFAVRAHGHFHSHSGARVGVIIGGPIGVPWYYPPAYYYPEPYSYYYPYSPPVVISSTPPTYIERQDEPATQYQPSTNYWYYCHDPDGFYPYVKQCKRAWEKVPASPPPPR